MCSTFLIGASETVVIVALRIGAILARIPFALWARARTFLFTVFAIRIITFRITAIGAVVVNALGTVAITTVTIAL